MSKTQKHEHINQELVAALDAHGIDDETLERVPLFSLIYQLGRADERHLATLQIATRDSDADVRTAAIA